MENQKKNKPKNKPRITKAKTLRRNGYRKNARRNEQLVLAGSGGQKTRNACERCVVPLAVARISEVLAGA